MPFSGQLIVSAIRVQSDPDSIDAIMSRKCNVQFRERQVSSIRCGLKGDTSKNVINLQMSKFQPDPKNPENGIGVEVSIWSPQSAWFKGIEDGDEVVVHGMWKTNTTASGCDASRRSL